MISIGWNRFGERGGRPAVHVPGLAAYGKLDFGSLSPYAAGGQAEDIPMGRSVWELVCSNRRSVMVAA